MTWQKCTYWVQRSATLWTKKKKTNSIKWKLQKQCDMWWFFYYYGSQTVLTHTNTRVYRRNYADMCKKWERFISTSIYSSIHIHAWNLSTTIAWPLLCPTRDAQYTKFHTWLNNATVWLVRVSQMHTSINNIQFSKANSVEICTII